MKKSYLFAATAILFWSTVATTAKLLLGSINNFQLLWMTSIFAAVFLLAVNLVTGNIKRLKEYKPKDFLISALIGLPGTFFYYVFYYAGTGIMTDASKAFIINYLWPIMSVVFACIILRERVTVRKVVAILMSFAGVIIVVAGGGFEAIDKSTLTGAALCVAGAVSYGIFTALNQKFYYEKRISMMINYFVTFTLTTVINGVSGNLFLPTLPQLGGFAWNGIFTVAIANTAWAVALESGKTAKISNLAYITPFLSLVWTSLILKEELSPYSLIGLVVIVAGIFVQLADRKKEALLNA